MTTFSYGQLESLWIQAGGSKALAPLMAAIALAESGGNSAAMNYTDNGGTQTSVGLWQVSTGTHQFPSSWTTPLGNAQEAVAKYKSQGLSAWGTYTSGAYKQFYKGGVNPSALPQGGGGGQASLTSSPLGNIGGDLINSVLSGLGLGSLTDLFKRLGLILLGGLIILVGIGILVSKPAVQITSKAAKDAVKGAIP
jgi:hypothetical protein